MHCIAPYKVYTTTIIVATSSSVGHIRSNVGPVLSRVDINILARLGTVDGLTQTQPWKKQRACMKLDHCEQIHFKCL